MKNQTYTANYNLLLFTFTDEGVKVVYAPALDLSGYGKTESDAKASFQLVLEEYTDYAIKKGTLLKDLQRLGWKLHKNSKKLKQAKTPDLADMLKKNDYLAEVFQNKNFKKYNEQVALPV